jgi:hypothetical protein
MIQQALHRTLVMFFLIFPQLIQSIDVSKHGVWLSYMLGFKYIAPTLNNKAPC